jgi:hypothetical protein
MGNHAFAGLVLSESVRNAYYCVFVGMSTGKENYAVIAIILSQMPLKSHIVKLFGGVAFIIISERILNIQGRLLTSSTSRNWEFHIHPMLYTASIQ